MRPLTDTTPKPLLPVFGRPLIEWHLQALARAGVAQVVINTAWLEEQFPAALGDGSRWGLRIRYSHEGRDHGGALETAGGIAAALEWLAPQGHEPFWVVSGDIHIPGFGFEPRDVEVLADSSLQALLWMVPNPDYHPKGDFLLDPRGSLHPPSAAAPEGRVLTYANVALMRPALVAGVLPGTRAALGPNLLLAAQQGRLGGRLWTGPWANVGTAQELQRLQGAAPS